jgi:hypothetical protein
MSQDREEASRQTVGHLVPFPRVGPVVRVLPDPWDSSNPWGSS